MAHDDSSATLGGAATVAAATRTCHWFRWHHGTVDDPKIGLAARAAGSSVAEAIAVWAVLLELASSAGERGNVGVLDFEAIDFRLGLDDGKSKAIVDAFARRRMILDDGQLANWEKRQPKRERADDHSTDRVRAFRERQRQGTPITPPETPTKRHETPTKRRGTPREEKSRDREEKRETLEKTPTPPLPPSSDASPTAADPDVPEPAAPAMVKQPKETWVTWYIEQWPHGALQPGALLRPLAKLRQELGEEATRKAWLAYCAASDPQFFSPPNFAAAARKWLQRYENGTGRRIDGSTAAPESAPGGAGHRDAERYAGWAADDIRNASEGDDGNDDEIA